MRPINPRNNECWLLESLPGDPETGVAVLVLECDDECAVAAPLFMDDDDALPGDRKLVPEPAFLVGESWVALGDTRRIPVSGFKRCLGEIPRWQATRLGSAECDFPRGLPLLAWLGDSRVGTRESLRSVLQAHAVSPAVEAVINFGRLIYDTVAKQWSRVADQVSETLRDMEVQTLPVPARMRGDERPETELTFAIPGGKATLRLEQGEKGWILKFHTGDTMQTVQLVDSAGAAHTGERFGFWWIFGEDAPIAAGECRLSWRREGEDAASIAVALPSCGDMR